MLFQNRLVWLVQKCFDFHIKTLLSGEKIFCPYGTSKLNRDFFSTNKLIPRDSLLNYLGEILVLLRYK